MKQIAYRIFSISSNQVDLPRVNTGADSNVIHTVLSFVFGLAAAIAFLITVYAGLKYVLSRGNPDNVKTAKETIIYAMVGLVITLSAYTIVQFAFNNIGR